MNAYDDYDDDDMYRCYQEWKLDHESAMRDLYDQDREKAIQKALLNEDLLRWEHELSQPDYPMYYLEEALFMGRKSRTQ